MANPEADDLARMCAAVFLYDGSLAAQEFLREKFADADLETRCNSMMALAKAYKVNKTPFVLEELAEQLNELFVETKWDSFADLGLNVDHRGQYLLRRIVSLVCSEQVESQLPALKVIAEREPSERAFAISAICRYESKQACQLMVQLLETGKYDSAHIASALAKNGYVEAIPSIVNLLGKDLKTNSTAYNPGEVAGLKQAMVLTALLKLNDKSVLPKIREFISAKQFPDQIAQAERLIIHLGDPDPVPKLLARLDANDKTLRSASTIGELRPYADPRCLKDFGTLAENSNNFWTRFHAIYAIEAIPGDKALLRLVELLDFQHPDDLETLEPPKDRQPGFLRQVLHQKTKESLQRRTGQAFGSEAIKWKSWILTNPTRQ